MKDKSSGLKAKESTALFVTVNQTSPDAFFQAEQKVAVRSHHPEVQKELSQQVEILKSTRVSEITELLERIGQLSFDSEDSPPPFKRPE